MAVCHKTGRLENTCTILTGAENNAAEISSLKSGLYILYPCLIERAMGDSSGRSRFTAYLFFTIKVLLSFKITKQKANEKESSIKEAQDRKNGHRKPFC
jgi:hypothetical protein